MDRNPTLVQLAPPSKQGALPLFLIHDGSGTTFSYHCLGALDRTVYAIHNPYFFSGHTWPGGIRDIAKIYAALIYNVVPRGQILLGGWSLGGLISLEIAHIFAKSRNADVVGIVMIDSIYPGALKQPLTKVVQHDPVFSDRCKPEIKMFVKRCMKQSSVMVDRWDLPLWAPRGRISNRRIQGNRGQGWVGNDQDDASHENNDVLDDRTRSPRNLLPPRAILLRCQNYVPVSTFDNPEAVSKVDVVRKYSLLGWDQYDNRDLVQGVLNIPGHHFDTFSDEHIAPTTAALREACISLQSGEIGWKSASELLREDIKIEG